MSAQLPPATFATSAPSATYVLTARGRRVRAVFLIAIAAVSFSALMTQRQGAAVLCTILCGICVCITAALLFRVF